MIRVPTTAILVFTNSAAKELEYKAIPRGGELFDSLTKTTLQKAARTGFPVFHVTEKEQVGSNFGERFTNAVSSVFEQGFENIITIGNDTPHLKTEHLKKAAHQLELGKTVIGPSVDGGFYLLGLQKINFDPTSFRNLPWQRFSLFNRISQWLQPNTLEIVRLPVLQDLDDEQDLKSILTFSRTLSSALVKLIHTVLGRLCAPFLQPQIFHDLLLSYSLYNKGSPKGLAA